MLDHHPSIILEKGVLVVGWGGRSRATFVFVSAVVDM